MATKLNLRNILDNNKLAGSNFLDWYRNLKIVLRFEKLLYVIENDSPPKSSDKSTQEVVDAYSKYKK